jgi:ketosteroid isomerase-like protein
VSEDREAVARRMYAVANEGRWREFLLLFAEDGVLEEALLADRVRYVGHDGIRDWMSVVSSAIVRPSWDVESVEEVGDGLLVRYTLDAEGATSAAPMSRRVFHAVRVRDGRIAYVGAFADEASARSELSSPSSDEEPSKMA